MTPPPTRRGLKESIGCIPMMKKTKKNPMQDDDCTERQGRPHEADRSLGRMPRDWLHAKCRLTNKKKNPMQDDACTEQEERIDWLHVDR